MPMAVLATGDASAHTPFQLPHSPTPNNQPMNTTHTRQGDRRPPTLIKMLFCAGIFVLQSVLLPAQTTAPAESKEEPEDEPIVLSPFQVDSTQDHGYQATSTLAGTRIRTNLADVGSAISVLTKEMITDLGGHNNESVLAYAVNTEVAGPRGNFSGANPALKSRQQQASGVVRTKPRSAVARFVLS